MVTIGIIPNNDQSSLHLAVLDPSLKRLFSANAHQSNVGTRQAKNMMRAALV
jgi:hypothetical protein